MTIPITLRTPWLAISALALLAGSAAAAPAVPIAQLPVQTTPLSPAAVADASRAPRDDSCLTDEQRAEFQARVKQLLVERTEELGMALAARVMENKANSLPSLPAVKESLQRCEEKVAASAASTPVPSTDPCANERKLLADAEQRGKSQPPLLAVKTLARSMRQMAEIRADYPRCDKKPE